MNVNEERPPLDEVIARAREEARTASRAADHGETDEYLAVMGRLREASAAAESATTEQTLLFAYARTYFMPPISFQALADASGLSYSGVRQRLTPEIIAMVRDAGRNTLPHQRQAIEPSNGD